MPHSRLTPRAAMLLALTLLLASCATQQSGLPPRVMPPEIQELSPLAVMPPDPDWCRPSCSAAWEQMSRRALLAWQRLEPILLKPSPGPGLPTTSAVPSTTLPSASLAASAVK